MKNTIKHLTSCCITGGLLLLGAIQHSQAAGIMLEVHVPRYGEVLVKPNAWPRYGGRVVWDSSIGSYVTDCVARGETVTTWIFKDANEGPTGLYEIYCQSQNKSLVLCPFTFDYARDYVVPTNAALDGI